MSYRQLDWLGLAIEPLAKPPTSSKHNTLQGCNFADPKNPKAYTHLYHSNKQKVNTYLLNTLIDMIINLSEKFKEEFSTTNFKSLNDNMKNLKNITKAVEHLIIREDKNYEILKQIINLQSEIKDISIQILAQNKIGQSNIDINEKLEKIHSIVEKHYNEWNS